jgi:hypothetical protein
MIWRALLLLWPALLALVVFWNWQARRPPDLQPRE